MYNAIMFHDEELLFDIASGGSRGGWSPPTLQRAREPPLPETPLGFGRHGLKKGGLKVVSGG